MCHLEFKIKLLFSVTIQIIENLNKNVFITRHFAVNWVFSPLVSTERAEAKQMKASTRGVSAYLKFRQEYSFTCHWLLIYSLEGPILFLWYQFLLTVALLTTSVNESLYNYDCWWPMTQTWRGCHYMNIKVIHRDAGPGCPNPPPAPPVPSFQTRPYLVWLYPSG